MRVRLVFIQEFYKLVGSFTVEAELPEGATVMDAIEYVENNVHKGFKDLVLDGDKLKYPVEIAVNGRRIDFLDGLHTKLNEGDQVLFSPRALFVL